MITKEKVSRHCMREFNTVSVMQPYIFPWIGYFQLINQADCFVLYDDAHFIKKGYINRNAILSAGQAQRFTLAVPGLSQNKRISELHFDWNNGKFLKTITHCYQRAPFYKEILPLIEDVVLRKDKGIAACCQQAIQNILGYLGLSKKLLRSSEIEYDRTENAENKIIGICKTLGCNTYVNSSGGRHLYSVQVFANQGIVLRFLRANNVVYGQQGTTEFVPNLSIIDVLMHCPPDSVRQALNHYYYEE